MQTSSMCWLGLVGTYLIYIHNSHNVLCNRIERRYIIINYYYDSVWKHEDGFTRWSVWNTRDHDGNLPPRRSIYRFNITSTYKCVFNSLLIFYSVTRACPVIRWRDLRRVMIYYRNTDCRPFKNKRGKSKYENMRKIIIIIIII